MSQGRHQSYLSTVVFGTRVMKTWGISPSDLLQENEFLYLNGSSGKFMGAVKFPVNTIWKGSCRRCGLTFTPENPLDMEDREYFCCPTCGRFDISWKTDQKQIISISTLLKRIPAVIDKYNPVDIEKEE